MTLLQCYTENEDESLDVDGVPADTGQCVQWADTVLNQVFRFPYFFAPGALDWWNNPSGSLVNFDKITDGSIVAGDFVIYSAGVGSVFGHIDVAAQDGSTISYVGYDSNWGGNLTVHTVTHDDKYNQYILGSLRLKEGGMNPTAQQAHDTVMAFETEADGITPHQPTQADLDFGVSTPWNAYIPNFYPGVQKLRNVIQLLENDRDTDLYPKINAVTSALGLPSSASATDMVAAIQKLQTDAPVINHNSVLTYIQENLK